MQVGQISFCDSVGYNIKSNDVKDHILKRVTQVYDIHVIRKHFTLFSNGDHKRLKTSPHALSLRSNGNPYYMLLLKIDQVRTCLFMDKKIQHGYCHPRMIIAPFMFHPSLSDRDTVFEGEMIKDEQGTWLFVINDILVMRGVKLTEEPLETRIQRVQGILADLFTPSPATDVCRFEIKRYFPCDRVLEMIQKFMPSLPYTCRGIYIKPSAMKHKTLYYNFDDSNIKSVHRQKLTTSFSTNTDGGIQRGAGAVTVHPRAASIAISKGSPDTRVFDIEKTEIPDVYKLITPEDGTFFDYACIRGMRVSKFMDRLFGNAIVTTRKRLLTRYVARFGKWEPDVAQPSERPCSTPPSAPRSAPHSTRRP